MEERRTGEIKKKILEVLEKMTNEDKNLQTGLAESLHKEIGGGKVVMFGDMFREIDCLRKGPDNPLNNLARRVWEAANCLDKEEYFDRREKQLIH